MKIFLHLLKSSFAYGTLAVFIWLSYIYYRFGFGWGSDTPLVWLVGVVIVGIFICMVCFPLMAYIVKSNSIKIRAVICSFVGLLSVLIFFALFTNYPLNTEYMVKRNWLYYLIFFIVGGLYGAKYSAIKKA